MAEGKEASTLKLVVFGATGGTGIEICKQALAQGHHVTVFARSPDKLALENPNLVKIKGQLDDMSAIEEAVKGADAVLCALGTTSIVTRDTTCSVATPAIMSAMERAGVKRLVVCTSYGCGPGNRSFLPWFVQLMLSNTLADKDAQEADVIKSGLEWTIVRPSRLMDAPAKGLEQVVAQEEGKLPVNQISRGDLAAFMLQVAAENTWVRKIAHLGWKA